ncbi:MAG: hypothetical protein GX614_14800, partial [Sandaracinaceae bacterium]|nr:hypothetical protein [Sandaracinaceae bacterium]
MTDTLREIEIDTNPRIQMTPDAIRHAKRTLSEAGEESIGLRIGVKGSG